MSKMGRRYLEMELDFERLSITSMEWTAEIWQEQANEGRFDGVIDFSHRYVYWFEDYAYLMDARSILKHFDIDYAVVYDTYSDQWILTTTYQSIEWRG
tara:strand:- start:828 stop:1121 length:294 start_codon:yes stop_codon:yes gene_type:complete